MNELDERKRDAAVALLRRVADQIADGRVSATQAVVVVRAPDAEGCAVSWSGSLSRAQQLDVAGMLHDAWPLLAGLGPGGKPRPTNDLVREGVERRRMNLAAAEQADLDYAAAYPVQCQCRKRFKSARGLAQHVRWGEGSGYGVHGSAHKPEPPVELGAPRLVS